jgi:hypothetical protein
LSALAEGNEREWRFRVFLDDKEIGYHEYRLREQDGQRLLETEASFEYKLLFIKLYEYAHENTELWKGDCLTQIESRTDANGDPFEVRGTLADGRFIVEGSQATAELPPCIMSFAYWNPAFLQQDRLLNSQNGEFVDIQVSEPERVEVEVRGSKQAAVRYRLEARELGIALWYSENQEWLALEADAAGGRKLRYELI